METDKHIHIVHELGEGGERTVLKKKAGWSEPIDNHKESVNAARVRVSSNSAMCAAKFGNLSHGLTHTDRLNYNPSAKQTCNQQARHCRL